MMVPVRGKASAEGGDGDGRGRVRDLVAQGTSEGRLVVDERETARGGFLPGAQAARCARRWCRCGRSSPARLGRP